MEIQGHLATVRVRARMRDVVAGGSPVPAAGTAADPETRMLGALRENPREAETLQHQLTAEVQRHLGSVDVVVSQVQFSAGSIEVLALIATTAKVVKELGDITGGLQTLRDAVPQRVRAWLTDAAQRVFARPMIVDTSDAAAVEMGEAWFSAQLRPDHADRADTQPQRPDVRAEAGRHDDQALTRSLVISHAILTLALVAAVVILGIEVL